MVTPAHCRCFADGLRYTNDSPHARSFIHTVLVRGVAANRKHRVVVVRMLFGCIVTTRNCCTTTGLLHCCIHTARLLYCCSHTIRRSYRPVTGLFFVASPPLAVSTPTAVPPAVSTPPCAASTPAVVPSATRVAASTPLPLASSATFPSSSCAVSGPTVSCPVVPTFAFLKLSLHAARACGGYPSPPATYNPPPDSNCVSD